MHDCRSWALVSAKKKNSIRLFQQPTLAQVEHGAPVYATLVPHATVGSNRKIVAQVPLAAGALTISSQVVCRVDDVARSISKDS